MEVNYYMSIFLDTRRQKKGGTYPVKLRVFTKTPRKQKLYSTKYEFSKKEFESIWETRRPRKEAKVIRRELQAIELKANEAADSLRHFNFEDFERVFIGGGTNKSTALKYWFADKVDRLLREDRVKSAESYNLCFKSLVRHCDKENISFYEITPEWLKKYEDDMISKGKSKTTVGIYLRALRAIFNNLIDEGVIKKEYYPFGRKKYKIPSPKTTKKALSKSQLKTLFEAIPKTPEQKKAKAFWFFSYSCNGINFKDISRLKYKNIEGDKFVFNRAKTSRTNRSQGDVTVFLSEYALSTIKEYGNPNRSPENRVFNIVNPLDNSTEQERQLKNFIRYINQHFKKFAHINGIKENVSTYWARHSFATYAINSGGASMEQISEALSHSNLNTTAKYFAGFEDSTKRDLSKKLFEFE